MATNLEALRSRIDAIDDKILALLAKRAKAALAIKKAKGKGTVYRPGREAAILRRMAAANTSKLPESSVTAIYREIIAACRNLESTLRVSYLGPAGSYSHEAAMQLVGSSSELVPEVSFAEAIKAAESGKSDAALLAIENTSEGMVVDAHKLLRHTSLIIIGEVVLPIRHCLLSTSKDIKEVREVHAHPQALGQCRIWLQVHLPNAELIAEPSNSRAAEIAATTPRVAAIASANAAEIVNVPILARDINDDPNNQTRFILLGKKPAEPTGRDKTSLICMVTNRPGSLHELLGVFAAQHINLIRLEAQPVSSTEYAFYIDMEGHQADPAVAKALTTLPGLTKDIINLGSYPAAGV